VIAKIEIVCRMIDELKRKHAWIEAR